MWKFGATLALFALVGLFLVSGAAPVAAASMTRSPLVSDALPPAPTNASAVVVSWDEIVLNWTVTIAEATSYSDVNVSLGLSCADLIYTSQSSGHGTYFNYTAYELTDLYADTEYSFNVSIESTTNAEIYSNTSACVSAVTMPAAYVPTAPTITSESVKLTGTLWDGNLTGGTATVALAWTFAEPFATGYAVWGVNITIENYTAGGYPWSVTYSPAVTIYTFDNLTSDSFYSVTITALSYNASLSPQYINETSIITPLNTIPFSVAPPAAAGFTTLDYEYVISIVVVLVAAFAVVYYYWDTRMQHPPRPK